MSPISTQFVASCALAALPFIFTTGCGGSDSSSAPLVLPPASATPAAQPSQPSAPSPGTLKITTLSSKPEMVTGDSALVEVSYPSGVKPESIRVTLNGADVSSSFTPVETGELAIRGLVTGLASDPAVATGSANYLSATDMTGSAMQASLTVKNFPITGPVLSGPHITPYECRTVQSGLGEPLDADCTATTRIAYFYKASDKSFKPLLDPTAARPPDVVNTTTSDGKTVPYIVRVESGTVNRGIFNIAVLDNPAVGSPLPTKFVPGPGWNRKLVLWFNGGGASGFNQGTYANTTALSDVELSRGFAYANSTEMWNSQHANPHLQGETAMMLKEYFTKKYGLPKWTVGSGQSGGAIQQYMIGQLYPGVLDGIQAALSLPETFMPNVYECRLANNVFKSDPSRWTTNKQVAIQGFNAGTCNSWDNAFAAALVRVDGTAARGAGCSLIDPANLARVYNAVTNPGGDLFCDFLETNTNLLGKDRSGRARRPLDNVGVQYGFLALNSGAITTTEFLDFNQLVGGFDRDGYSQAIASPPVLPGAPAARHEADLEAVRLAYAGGFKNSFTGPGLAYIPIITQRANASAVGDYHDPMQDLIIRARLQRENGSSENQIIFSSSAESAASGFDLLGTSLDVINDWLDNIAVDQSVPSIDKVAKNKPSKGPHAGMAVDTCWDKAGVRIAEVASLSSDSKCNAIYPRFSTLRLAAGESMVQDGVRCQLKPVRASDYNVTFTAAELDRLNQIFPTGVCDWTRPGVNQVPLRGTYLRLPLL